MGRYREGEEEDEDEEANVGISPPLLLGVVIVVVVFAPVGKGFILSENPRVFNSWASALATITLAASSPVPAVPGSSSCSRRFVSSPNNVPWPHLSRNGVARRTFFERARNNISALVWSCARTAATTPWASVALARSARTGLDGPWSSAAAMRDVPRSPKAL